MITLEELKARLARECDEVTLLELLEIDAEELVEVFVDKIEARFTKLVTALGPTIDEELEDEN